MIPFTLCLSLPSPIMMKFTLIFDSLRSWAALMIVSKLCATPILPAKTILKPFG